MRRVSTQSLLLLSLLILSSSAAGLTECINPYSFAQEQVIVSVAPASITVPANQNFAIDINVTAVTDLYGWEFQLSWNSSLLSMVDVSEGQFLKSGGTTFFTFDENDTSGNLTVDCTLTGNVPGVNGNGRLATLTFNASKVGQCPLNLRDVKLADSSDNSIPVQTTSGYCSVTLLYNGHDVAALTVTPSKTVVGQGYNNTFAVVVEDDGIFNETATSIIYVGLNAVYTHVLSLQSGQSGDFSYAWNSSPYAKAVYAVSAYVQPVPGETFTANNNCSGGNITVTIPGDLNGDFKVSLSDLVIFATSYGSKPGNSNWNPNSDIDGKGVVGLSDLVILAVHYGQHYP